MNDTHFINCTGLDVDGHVTSAYDIAIMSRELIRHETIKRYTTIWMDSLRGGLFQLANTNRLIRSYNGATGLKTGSTSIAKYCLAATAQRDGMELIATIMAAPTTDVRFDSARALLDYGFANYALVNAYPDDPLLPVPVKLGKVSEVQPVLSEEEKLLVEKSTIKSLEKTCVIEESVNAPVKKGQKLGEMTVKSGGEVIATIPIVACEAVEKLSMWDIFTKAMSSLFMS
jgi:D-alanyl-D-alanine carboxypeptidase (penicillin-binding protein 5/6)